METSPFVEFFEALNATRWLANSTGGLLACGPGYQAGECTMARSSNMALDVPLPFYPTGVPTGAVLSLSQARRGSADPIRCDAMRSSRMRSGPHARPARRLRGVDDVAATAV